MPHAIDYKKILFLTVIVAGMLFCVGRPVQAANIGDTANFNVDPAYDATGRSKVGATLIEASSSLYFYVETTWWSDQTQTKKNQIIANLDALSDEFGNKIYPTLTMAYGSEWSPGIDGDTRITLFFESVKENLGGYFRSDDEYSKLQAPSSNEREMLYMPIAQINSSQLKVFLAHEFVHLIVFNQKDRLQGVSEETWLSEARSDYASTLLGYDDVYQDSNLQRRVQDFLVQPRDSLTEWQSTKYDYAVESVFMHYLADRYGSIILTDSQKSPLVGIASINEALVKYGVHEDFAQIFTDWTVTMVINNCSFDAKYCYKNKNLADLRINPTLVFLPLTGNSSLSMNNTTKNWSANWQKIIGGNGDLTLSFSGFKDLDFALPYLVYDKNNNYVLHFLKPDANGKGTIAIKNFGINYNSLIIIPSLQTKITGFNGLELSYPYTLTISITTPASKDDSLLIQKLQEQIAALKKQIADILASRSSLSNNTNNTCSALLENLSLGMHNNGQVSCLQQFLVSQGVNVYPEGLVTGNFGNVTKSAVVRFQAMHGIKATGFVGPQTRQKINELLK